MLDAKRLRVLKEFAAHGTIAGAADALAYTPSAVSQQLSQLEREVGVQLFRKEGRRLRLTDAGQALLGHAQAILERIERAEVELAVQAGEVRGSVSVAAFQLAAQRLVLPALSLLSGEHPALEVRLIEEEAEISIPLLAAGRLDVALAEEYEHAPRARHRQLERIELQRDDMLLALPRDHPAAGGEAVRLWSLRDAVWATAAEGTSYADMFVRLCRGIGAFEPDIRHRASDFRILLDLVGGGHAVALLPALGRPEADPGVAVRPLADGRFPRRLFLLVRAADRPRPALDAVVSVLTRIAWSAAAA
jgi:DNA-binding transcriptional LysR family regulator